MGDDHGSRNAVGLVFSDNYRKIVCTCPKFSDRFSMVMDLINAYHLVKYLVRIPPVLVDSSSCDLRDLTVFHSGDYLCALRKLQEVHRNYHDEAGPDESDFEPFGLSYDCPGFPHVFDYALACVQGSVAAAEALLRKHCQIAINWAGGWHHAKRSEAEGFCYLNDVVLAIQRLQTGGASRVLYIDLDLHHGDGVEEAFWYSPRVVTFSVHHASPGFFPGSGTWTSDATGSEFMPSGAGRGRFSAFNLPLGEGVDDVSWSYAVLPVLSLLHAVIRPDFIVVQCGADGLTDDPHRVFNLTNADPTAAADDSLNDSSVDVGSYTRAVKLILSWKLPTLMLGGGGYHFASTARLWTVLTALAINSTTDLNLKLVSDIPEHSYLSRYGPDFGLYTTSLPKIRPKHDLDAHLLRLLDQVCCFARLNELSVDRDDLQRLMDETIASLSREPVV